VGRNGAEGPIPYGVPIGVQIAGRNGVRSTGVSAAMMDVTATEPTRSSFLTVWPGDDTRPELSNLNFVGGQNVADLVTGRDERDDHRGERVELSDRLPTLRPSGAACEHLCCGRGGEI
jgi:hypothetical protein